MHEERGAPHHHERIDPHLQALIKLEALEQLHAHDEVASEPRRAPVARRGAVHPRGSGASWRRAAGAGRPGTGDREPSPGEFLDEEERYGDRGLEWCAWDNQWILAWAAADAVGYENLDREIEWLAGILNARGYPVERLARDLEMSCCDLPPPVAHAARSRPLPHGTRRAILPRKIVAVRA